MTRKPQLLRGSLGTRQLGATNKQLRNSNQRTRAPWIHLDNTANGQPAVQYLSFTTPLEQPPDDRCGRVVYSDIHVASGDRSNGSLAYPSGGCTSNVAQLSPQEKVLAFMIFDIGSCIEAPLF